MAKGPMPPMPGGKGGKKPAIIVMIGLKPKGGKPPKKG